MSAYVMAPDGQVCQIPEDQLEAALAGGGKLLSEREVSTMAHKRSMAVRFFEQEWKKKQPRAFRLNRRRYR